MLLAVKNPRERDCCFYRKQRKTGKKKKKTEEGRKRVRRERVCFAARETEGNRERMRA
jgi:hypothetical protein